MVVEDGLGLGRVRNGLRFLSAAAQRDEKSVSRNQISRLIRSAADALKQTKTFQCDSYNLLKLILKGRFTPKPLNL